MVNGKIDDTVSLLHSSDLLADCTSCRLPADGMQKPKPTRSGEGLTPSFPCVPGPSKHSKVHHRIHFRLVFKEVCKPIYELQNLAAVFKILQDVHKALQFLHSVGWVHRDISTGNILCAGAMGKLADLEYAKCMNSNITHEVRTGTLDFMACEVEVQNCLFQRRRHRPFGEVSNTSFRFNPLHDMESLWWIHVWILYCHVGQKGDRRSPSQEMLYQALFPGGLNACFSQFSVRLDYCVLPASFRCAGYEVESMHQELLIAYEESERSLPQQPPAYTAPLEYLHSVFTECLTTAIDCSTDVTLFVPTAKREQEEEDPALETRVKKLAKLK